MTTEDRYRDSIHIADLSPDAQEVLRRVVEKFRAGVKEHGPLNVEARHWGPELLNEAIDMLHYCIFELMRLERVAETDAVPCTCVEDYIGGGGVLQPGIAIPMCDACLQRHLSDDGLSFDGQWEASNVSE